MTNDERPSGLRTVSDNSDKVIHPFGGCNRLAQSYELIGQELLKYDMALYRYNTAGQYPDFRTGVASVQVEVLESYLEDLLDLDVPEQKLSIVRRHPHYIYHWLSLSGLLGSVGTGLYAVSTGASLVLSFGITVVLSLPFGVLWHFAPRGGLVRRLAFAQIVSHEISRRRGTDRNDDTDSGGATVLTSLLTQSSKTSRLQGAARSLLRQ